MARPRRWRRVLAIGALIVGGALGVALIGVGGAFVWLGTPKGNEWLTRQLVERVKSRQVEGDFTVGSIDTDVWGRAVLEDVRITDGDGKVLLGADRIALRYDLWPLLGKEVQIDELEARGLVVDLEQRPDGLLDLQRVFGQTEPAPDTGEPWQGLPIALDVDELRAYGSTIRVTVEKADGSAPTVWSGVGVNVIGEVHGAETRIDIPRAAITGVLTSPYSLPIAASGGLVYEGESLSTEGLTIWGPETKLTAAGRIDGLGDTPRYDLTVDAQPFDLDVIERFTGGGKQDFRGRLAGQLAVTGSAEALNVKGDLLGADGTPGAATVDLTFDTTQDGSPFRGTVDARGLRVDELYRTPDTELELNGRLAVDGRLGTWPEEIVATGRYEGGRTVLYRPEKEQYLEFDTLTADLSLEKGVVTFRNAEGSGPIGEISANGTIDVVSGELATDVGGQVVLEVLERLGFQDLGGGGSVTVRVTGNVFAEDLPLDARGTVVIAPFVYQGGEVRFERLVADFSWWMRGQTQHVAADVTAEDGDMYGLLVATLRSPDVAVELPPSGEIFARGTGTADAMEYPESFRVETATLAYDVRVPPDESGNDAIVSLEVGPHTLLDGFPGSSGTVDVEMHGDDVAYTVDLDAYGREFVHAKGTYGMVTERVVLDELMASPTPRQRWVGEGTQSFTVVDGGVRDARIVAVSDLGRVEVHGDVATEGPLDGAIVTQGLSLDVVAELAPESSGGLSGMLDLTLGLQGTADQPRLTADIDAESLWVPGFSRWLDVSGHVDGDRRRLDVDVAVGAAGQSLAVIDGIVPVDLDLADPKLDVAGSVDVRLILAPGSLARLEWLSEEELGLPEGRISAVLEAEGVLGDPDFHLTGVVEADVPGWQDRGRVELDVDRRADRMKWWADLREGYAIRGEVAGEGRTRIGEAIAWAFAEEGTVAEPDWNDWTLYVDDMNARVAALGTPVRSLLALAEVPFDAGGELLGGFVVTGSPRQPVASGALNWVEGSLGGVPVPGGYFALVPAEGREGYQVDLSLEFEDDGSFVASGILPLKVDLTKPRAQWELGELDVPYEGKIPVGVLAAFDPDIREAEGMLALSGRLGGTTSDPEPEGTALLQGGSFDYPPLGVRYTGIGLDLAFDAQKITLRDLSITSEELQSSERTFGFLPFEDVTPGALQTPGTLRASGSARLEDWQPRGVSVRAVADRFKLTDRSEQLLEVSGEVSAQGDWPALRIRGNAVVDRGLFVYDAAEFGGGSSFELDRDLVVHRPGFEIAEVAAEEEPPIWASFDVELGLDLNRAMEVRADLPFVEEYGTLGALVSTVTLNARLGSRDLLVTVRNGEIAALHEVEVIEGTASVLSSTFDVERGTLTFLGDPSNPLIDVEAVTNVSSGSVTMRIAGQPSDPENLISFTSEEFTDQTEIFTVLLTGEAPEEFVGGGGPDASGLLVSAFSGLLLGGVGTQSFTVDPDGTIRIRTGNPRILGLPARTEFLVNLFADQDENDYAFSADVSLSRQIAVEAAYGNERSWADLYWEFRF
jgi:hypothetical protein